MPDIAKIEVTRKINAPIETVSDLLEDVKRTPQWNPLVRRIVPTAKGGRGVGSALKWEGFVAGIPIHGSSKTVAWSRGKKYAWRSEGQVQGQTDKRVSGSVDGTFLLEPAGEQTKLTAVVSIKISRTIRPLVNDKTAREV